MGPVYVAVVGASEASADLEVEAETVGHLLARHGAVVVCGGLGGVMAAACRGAKAGGGTTLGILPGTDRRQANPWVDVAVTTGMGEARNAIVVRTADVLIARPGGYGNLSEIARALRLGRAVLRVSSWDIDGVVLARDPADAVALALNSDV